MKLKLKKHRSKDRNKGKASVESIAGSAMANSPQYTKLSDGLEKSETKVTEKSSTCESDSISTNSVRMKSDTEHSAITGERVELNEKDGHVIKPKETNIEEQKETVKKPKRRSSILVSTMDKFVAKMYSEETDFSDDSEYTYSSQTADDDTYTQYTRADDEKTDYVSEADTFNYEGSKMLPIFCGWFLPKDPDYIFVKQYVNP